MKTKKEAHLIISLIIDDITNTMLVIGLQRLGFDAGNYMLSVNAVIFKLMGYDDRHDEPVYEVYLSFIEQEAEKQIRPDRRKLRKPAKEIYKFLRKSCPKK